MKLLASLLLFVLFTSNSYALTITEIPRVTNQDIKIIAYPETQILTTSSIDGRTNTVIQTAGKLKHTDLVIAVESGSETERELNQWLEATPLRRADYLRDIAIKKLNKEYEPIRIITIKNAFVNKRVMTESLVRYHITVNSMKVEVLD